MKHFYLLLLCGLFTLQSWAQGIHFGLTTGVSNTYVLDKGLSKDPRYVSQGTYKWQPAGLSIGLDFGSSLGLQFEVLASKAGQSFSVVDVNQQEIGQRELDLNYMSMPLMLQFAGSRGSTVQYHFMLGPQLSLLTSGKEVMQYQSGQIKLPEGATPPEGAVLVDEEQRIYDVPAYDEVLASSEGEGEELQETDVQIAFDLGLRIMLSKNLFINTDLRGNYGFVDMRSEDMINEIKSGANVFGRRANVLIGAQIGLNYYIGF